MYFTLLYRKIFINEKIFNKRARVNDIVDSQHNGSQFSTDFSQDYEQSVSMRKTYIEVQSKQKSYIINKITSQKRSSFDVNDNFQSTNDVDEILILDKLLSLVQPILDTECAVRSTVRHLNSVSPNTVIT